MRLLLDANLSPRIVGLLNHEGLEVSHVRDHGLQRATDAEILLFARDYDFVVVSEDTDFGELLARQRAATPSFVLLRSGEPMTPEQQARLLAANLPPLRDELESGAVVVLEPARMRVRKLPIRPVG